MTAVSFGRTSHRRAEMRGQIPALAPPGLEVVSARRTESPCLLQEPTRLRGPMPVLIFCQPSRSSLLDLSPARCNIPASRAFPHLVVSTDSSAKQEWKSAARDLA